jgi:hypothetical protein
MHDKGYCDWCGDYDGEDNNLWPLHHAGRWVYLCERCFLKRHLIGRGR